MAQKPRTPRRGGASIARMLVGVAAVLGIVVVVVLAIGGFLVFGGSPDTSKGKAVQIEVPSGASTREIAAVLAESGVVGNANMFRLQARIARADGTLRSGVYELATGMPSELVIEKLQEGPPISYVTVTVPEGFTIEQVAARFEKAAGIPAEEMLKLTKGGAEEFVAEHPYLEGVFEGSLEGYLFPKTYRVKEGATAREAIEIMLDQFDDEFARVDVAPIEARGLTSAQLVTLASMIERETRVAKERRLVSSVIFNRLDRDMMLEIDATIEYVLPGNRLRLRNSHLRIDSPYNTYRNKGLPPGPISNPGLASLKAAANPADTKYVYYVLTGKDGSHTFATNEKDFLVAKRRSKEVFGK